MNMTVVRKVSRISQIITRGKKMINQDPVLFSLSLEGESWGEGECLIYIPAPSNNFDM
jgi:hypothetical protein